MDKLSNFVEKLAQKTGRYISYASPMLDGSLPDGSRVNATYTKDISSKGPTFTIRKFTKTPWTPIQLMGLHELSPEMLAYFWIILQYQSNIMIEYKNKFPQVIIFPVTLDNYNLSELDTRFKTPFEIQKAANKCDYHRQAIQFLRDTKSKIVIERGGIDATSEDEWRRERYKFTCTLSRMKGAKEYKMSFPFWGCSKFLTIFPKYNPLTS